MYTIKITYETGNTFNTSIDEDVIDIEWESIQVAKDTLKDIKEHYKFTKELDDANHRGRFRSGMPTKGEAQLAREQVLEKASVCGWFDSDNPEYYMKIRTDTGFTRIRCFWIGYFEVLHRIEIICTGDDDMSYDFV